MAQRSVRRSKNTKISKDNKLPSECIDDDLVLIREYAKKYNEHGPNTKKILSNYVLDNKSLEFYHGAYVTTHKLFTMARMSNNNIDAPIMEIIYAISHKIVQYLDNTIKDTL